MQLLARVKYFFTWITILWNQIGCLAALIVGLRSFFRTLRASLGSTKVSHIVTEWLNHEVYIKILLLTAYSKSHHWDSFHVHSVSLSWESQLGQVCFQFISKLGVPFLGQAVICSFCYAEISSWNWAIFMHLLARLRCSCMGYNLMCPSRMLNCSLTLHNSGKKLFPIFLASLGSTKFQPHHEWKNHEVCILLLLLARNGGIMRYVYIYCY